MSICIWMRVLGLWLFAVTGVGTGAVPVPNIA